MNIMVGARGFEPPTTSTPRRCATRLRYAPSIVCAERRAGPLPPPISGAAVRRRTMIPEKFRWRNCCSTTQELQHLFKFLDELVD